MPFINIYSANAKLYLQIGTLRWHKVTLLVTEINVSPRSYVCLSYSIHLVVARGLSLPFAFHITVLCASYVSIHATYSANPKQ